MLLSKDEQINMQQVSVTSKILTKPELQSEPRKTLLKEIVSRDFVLCFFGVIRWI
jgi:hypothetical protein